MPDYRHRRCVICNRVGGIEQHEGDLYVCKHCQTPYLSYREAAPPPPPKPPRQRKKDAPDRFVWFTYRDGERDLAGFYDCPVIEAAERPKLTTNRKRLRFLRYLVEKGLLADDTQDSQRDHH